MALSTILSRLETACATMSGVATVRIPASERPLQDTQLPAIVSESISFDISPSTMSVWDYDIPLFYLHAERSTDSETQLNAIADKPKALVDVLNANVTLAGAVYGMAFDSPSGEFGAIPWRDKTYTGFSIRLRLKEKYATTFAG